MPRIVWISVALGLLIAGCSTTSPFHTTPRLPQRIAGVSHIAMLPARVRIYELGAGGLRELKSDWSARGTENVSRAFADLLQARRGVHVTAWDSSSAPPALRDSLADTYAMFDAVNAAVLLHTYNEDGYNFKDKTDQFDYSLGADIACLDTAADAFLVVMASDYIASSGRIAAQTGAVIVGALVGVSVTPVGAPTFVYAALVDRRTGDILWHSAEMKRGEYDLRDQSSAAAAIDRMIPSFPLGTAVEQ